MFNSKKIFLVLGLYSIICSLSHAQNMSDVPTDASGYALLGRSSSGDSAAFGHVSSLRLGHEAWIEWRFKQPQQNINSNGKKILYTIKKQLIEADCHNRKIRIKDSHYFYYSNYSDIFTNPRASRHQGKLVDSFDFSPFSNYLSVPPNSLGEIEYQFICQGRTTYHYFREQGLIQ